jgi:hypothetical protein
VSFSGVANERYIVTTCTIGRTSDTKHKVQPRPTSRRRADMFTHPATYSEGVSIVRWVSNTVKVGIASAAVPQVATMSAQKSRTHYGKVAETLPEPVFLRNRPAASANHLVHQARRTLQLHCLLRANGWMDVMMTAMPHICVT